MLHVCVRAETHKVMKKGISKDKLRPPEKELKNKRIFNNQTVVRRRQQYPIQENVTANLTKERISVKNIVVRETEQHFSVEMSPPRRNKQAPEKIQKWLKSH